MNPLEWAKAAVENMGFTRAYMICQVTGRPLIGNQNETPNPHEYFFKMSRSWIVKNMPEKLKKELFL